MRCEICGKKVIGKPLRTKIDNSIMLTCNDCSKFGKVQRETPQTQRRGRAPTSRRRSYRSQEPTQEVVEDFHKLIREAREKKGWSREELGEKTYEKVSVINRLESGKMIPDLKLARKMEKVLKITLLEKTDQAQIDDLNAAQLRKATIGDIARIKKG
ncbi:MAG: putative transcription factor [Methanobacterium sp.]|uniref:multiprotein bridging factor aMBF1 n=1 Tax=Methanobacterium sp. TaxID=2164 RepID=UPI0024AC42F5|nr:multiprotein bridging factor aMBF1 [Methanobacterium sp.]MDI3550452.1 putative transcription factor [Methanobacterium sp.]